MPAPTRLLSPLSLMLLAAFPLSAHADDADEQGGYAATLPTITVVGQPETSILKGYIDYGEAAVTRNGLRTKEIPQTVDTLNIQKNKNYGTNDLSSILEGNAGIDAAYDMRGESIMLRGFNADANDIYRDGVRESGQVRRSTANIERVEILKGPSSVLYGRTNGGGVINMVSKYANFKQSRNVGVSLGSWENRSLNVDVNEVLNPHVALRLSGEVGRANSFRSGIDSKNAMISPSITLRFGSLKWTGQYTYDKVKRTPDRGPSKNVYDHFNLSYRTGFAHPNDFVEDKLQVWRSNLEYAFNERWNLQWQLAHRRAAQDFDHFYAGRINGSQIVRNYAWQQTDNKTLSSSFTLNGDYQIGRFDNHLTVGFDASRENRNPTLGYRGSFTVPIDPYNRDTWLPSGRLQPILTQNQHKADSYGLFVQNIFSLTPQLKFVAGGRYDKYTFRSENKLRNTSQSYSGHSFSPNFGAVWDITPAHTVYAGYNKGFSPYGGRSYMSIDAVNAAANSNTSPEYAKQYETGIKSSWLGGKLDTTLALYQIERYNIRYRPDPQNDPFHWEVSGKHRSRGAELSAIGQIVPQKLYLRGSFGVMQAKVVKDDATPNNVGQHLSGTSSVTGNLFFRYTPTAKLYGEVGITGSGKRYGYTRAGAADHLPGFARVDAMVGWNWKQLNTTFAVGNLFDRKYWRSDAMPAAPRNYTLRVNYSF